MGRCEHVNKEAVKAPQVIMCVANDAGIVDHALAV